MHFTTIIRTSAFLFLASGIASAAAKAAGDEAIDRDIANLIEGLVSRSPQPGPGSGPVPEVPAHIWKSVDGLHQLGVQTFPQLIKHFDDERYCLTEESRVSGNVSHCSVGYVCRHIIKAQVNKFAPVRMGRGRAISSFDGIPFEKKPAEEWWDKNKTKELWELQADNIRSCITSFEQLLPTLEREELKAPFREAIRANQDMLNSLTRSKAALSSKPFRVYFDR